MDAWTELPWIHPGPLRGRDARVLAALRNPPARRLHDVQVRAGEGSRVAVRFTAGDAGAEQAWRAELDVRAGRIERRVAERDEARAPEAVAPDPEASAP